jgi:hypothetical protein
MLLAEASLAGSKTMLAKVKNEEEASGLLPASEYKATIAVATEINKRVEANKARALVSEVFEELRKQRIGLDADIEAIDNSVAEAVKQIKLPIDGLTLGDNGVLLNGILYSELSSAEQIKISMALAMAQKPDLRVMFIKEGSLLDEESLATISKMAEEADYQVWMECVGTDGDVGVVIEDGGIVSIDGVKIESLPEKVEEPVKLAVLPSRQLNIPGIEIKDGAVTQISDEDVPWKTDLDEEM